MLEIHPIVYPLFSTPVYHVEDTGLRIEENILKDLENLPLPDRNGPGLTEDLYILKKPELRSAYDVVKQHLDFYVKNICGFNEEFILINTWLTRNKTGQNHYRHFHPNSIFNGVLYLRADPNTAPIHFHGKTALSKGFDFTYTIDNFNIYNSENWQVPVQTGSLLIFPSTLEHSAGVNESPETRICLGFNAFVRAKFGSHDYASDIDLSNLKDPYND